MKRAFGVVFILALLGLLIWQPLQIRKDNSDTCLIYREFFNLIEDKTVVVLKSTTTPYSDRDPSRPTTAPLISLFPQTSVASIDQDYRSPTNPAVDTSQYFEGIKTPNEFEVGKCFSSLRQKPKLVSEVPDVLLLWKNAKTELGIEHPRIFELSPVSYSAATDYGLFYVNEPTFGLGGQSYFLLVQKFGTSWKIVGFQQWHIS